MSGILYIKLLEHSNAWNKKTTFNKAGRVMSAVKKIFVYEDGTFKCTNCGSSYMFDT